MTLFNNRRIHCPACGLKGSRKFNWAIVAPWINELGSEKLGPTKYRKCSNCGLGWSDIQYSVKTLNGIYSEYRGANYFRIRNSWEPTYSEQINQDLDFGDGFLRTRREFISTLIKEIDDSFIDLAEGVIDVGGGHGGVMPNWPTLKKKFVLEISNALPVDGIESISSYDQIKSDQSIDLIMCCGILEHLNSPKEFLKNLAQKTRKMRSKGVRYYYFEVPFGIPEMRTNFFFIFVFISSFIRPLWNKYDLYLKNRFREFLPIRVAEHIQFFDEKCLETILISEGFQILNIRTYESLASLKGAASLNFQKGIAVIAKID